ncbi:MAG: hypothetical protein AB8V06_04720 [Francisella endosymbiont of Hyalomma asiaticum]
MIKKRYKHKKTLIKYKELIIPIIVEPYLRYGFHEYGILSAVNVTAKLEVTTS